MLKLHDKAVVFANGREKPGVVKGVFTFSPEPDPYYLIDFGEGVSGPYSSAIVREAA